MPWSSRSRSAPPGSPDHGISRAPFLPGTGPYMISRYRPNATMTLVRNPYFRQWSYAAQPAGYPDVIRFEQVAGAARQQSAVAAGRADLVDLYLNPQPYPDLAARYPTRVHAGLMLSTTYLFLNTRQPPFTNLKARQAVNYAIDRARMLRLFRYGPGEAAVTCQILPAGFPSFQRYCPYTAGAGDSVWHGPDMEKARRLAKESGTTNVPVTVWTIEGIADPAVGAYLVQMLDDLGYRASLRTAPLDRFVNTAVDARNKIQMGLFAWIADYPAAGTFFLPLLSCRSFNEDPTNTLNLAEYCDPRVDALAAKAEAAQLTDPAAARSLWAQVDRLVADQAPWVPVLNEARVGFVSSRVGNFQDSPAYTYLVDQMWVR